MNDAGLVRRRLADAATALANVSQTPRLDAELLMAHAMGISREDMLLRCLDHAVPTGFDALISRRMAHEPMAYITGSRAFWTIDIMVGPGVLIPRPDSETLIEAAVAHFGGEGPGTILDLGTGPGSLLLAALAEWPRATGLGVDRSESALAMARANADRLGLARRAAFALGNWAAGMERRFDLVLANPPYIAADEKLPADVVEYEPHQALYAGADGMDDYRVIIPQLPRLLAPGGIAVIEIGHTQAEAVTALIAQTGLKAVLRHDLGGRPRAIVAC